MLESSYRVDNINEMQLTSAIEEFRSAFFHRIKRKQRLDTLKLESERDLTSVGVHFVDFEFESL